MHPVTAFTLSVTGATAGMAMITISMIANFGPHMGILISTAGITAAGLAFRALYHHRLSPDLEEPGR